MALKKQEIMSKKRDSAGVDRMRESLEQDLKAGDVEVEDKENDDDDDYDDDEELLQDKESLSPKVIMVIAACVVIIIVFVIAFFVLKKEPEPPTEELPQEVEETVDPSLVEKQNLYASGIGKEYVDELNVFEQGNLENDTFRKDFKGQGQPEMFVEPIKIGVVRDGVAYTKHRAQTGDGIEIYWVEGEYQGKPCAFTIPYSIYQVIAPTGVLDVEVEVVTDANDSQTITNFVAIPPTQVE